MALVSTYRRATRQPPIPSFNAVVGVGQVEWFAGRLGSAGSSRHPRPSSEARLAFSLRSSALDATGPGCKNAAREAADEFQSADLLTLKKRLMEFQRFT